MYTFKNLVENFNRCVFEAIIFWLLFFVVLVFTFFILGAFFCAFYTENIPSISISIELHCIEEGCIAQIHWTFSSLLFTNKMNILKQKWTHKSNFYTDGMKLAGYFGDTIDLIWFWVCTKVNEFSFRSVCSTRSVQFRFVTVLFMFQLWHCVCYIHLVSFFF